MKSSSPQPSKKKPFNYARYVGMAFQMMGVMLAGIFGGMQLDKWLKLGLPIFTIILTLISVAAAMYFVVRGVSKKDQ